MNMDFDNLGTIAALIGIGVVYWQGRQAKTQNEISLASLREDNLRLKRETTYTVIEHWSEKLDKAQPAARGLVNTFDYDTCVLLHVTTTVKLTHYHRIKIDPP